MASKHKGAEHHTKAAEHHDHAARHHREAAKHHDSGSHEKGGHHAHTAHGHMLHARHHANEAGKHHADEHGGVVAAWPEQFLEGRTHPLSQIAVALTDAGKEVVHQGRDL